MLKVLKLNIEDMKTSNESEEQALYVNCFGNKTATQESFIIRMSKYTMKAIRFLYSLDASILQEVALNEI